jgi:hypothetical protein
MIIAVRKDESIDKHLREWIGEKASAGGEKPAGKTAACETAGGAAAETACGKKSGLLANLGAWVKKSVNCCIE